MLVTDEVEILYEHGEYVARYRECEGYGNTLPRALHDLATEINEFGDREPLTPDANEEEQVG